MFQELLEKIIQMEILDRDDPSKKVKVHRYVIDPNEKPTAVIFGKFIPWTGPNGHGKLIKIAEEIFGKDNFIIVSPTRKVHNPKVDIFTDEQKEQIIHNAVPNAIFLRVDSNIPIRMFTEVIQKSKIQRPVFIVGPDRIEDFKKFFIPYSPKNKGITDPNHKDFGKGEYYYISGEKETTGTKVRQALLQGNKEEFINLTGYNELMWDLMRRMLKNNGIIKEKSLRFAQYYLIEGGNVVVKNIKADKIQIEKMSKEQFEHLKESLSNLFKKLNDSFMIKYDKYIWSNLENLIKTGKIFSGSTRLMFVKSYEDFVKYKKVIGDIDIQVPSENIKELEMFLDSNEGKTYGNFIYLGKGGNSPIQINTIFQTNDFPGILKNIQIDFEPTLWKKNEPTEFSIFGHYSDWEDVKENIKGVFSKYLLRCLVSREKLDKIAVMTPTGKISTSKKYEEPVSMKSFSVDKGLRLKYIPVLDVNGNIRKTESGLPIYRELSTAESDYETNLDNIFAIVFKKMPTNEEKRLFHSYVGILRLMKKYLKMEEIKDVFESFKKLLWGVQAQEIEQGEFVDEINQNDFKVKKLAYDKFLQVFPELIKDEKDINILIKKYYLNLKSRKLEKGKLK